ncbi:MAG: hypothetical protein ACOCZQ_03145 [Nanoarchaeota archaeon]
MEREKLHFYLSSTLLIIGFFALLGLFLMEPFEVGIEGKVVDAPKICEDGTPVGECSIERFGNKCKITKDGPGLRFAEECYALQ